ncbi:hypothetical protein ACTWQB_05745 [Piscibacillus sp. B03]|uniref:hypothetical protein n=1 Tax=Piscibacillus sp. B03 TaxID=3457430 RepID=UPI003FCE80FA
MKKHLSFKTVTASIIVLTLGSLFLLWAFGYFSLWLNGIKHLAHDPENTYHTTVPHEEEYTVEIDLTDLESNKGKLLFKGEEGRHVYVSSVLEHEEAGYEVIFRAKGNYELDRAILVSGIEYDIEPGSFGRELRAKAHIKYQDEAYALQSSLHTNLIHKDGDEFGFYLNPLTEELDGQEIHKVEVTVSNLVANIWLDKDLFKPY